MNYFQLLLTIAMLALIVAFFFTMIRFLYGPTLIDRIITFDLMSVNLIGVISIYAVISGNEMLLDLAVVLALVAFFAIVAFAYYIKYRNWNDL